MQVSGLLHCTRVGNRTNREREKQSEKAFKFDPFHKGRRIARSAVAFCPAFLCDVTKFRR